MRHSDPDLLASMVRASSAPASLALRARIALLAAEGTANTEIARRVDVSGPTVLARRNRHEASGLVGLEDLARSGRPAMHHEVTTPSNFGSAGESFACPVSPR